MKFSIKKVKLSFIGLKFFEAAFNSNLKTKEDKIKSNLKQIFDKSLEVIHYFIVTKLF